MSPKLRFQVLLTEEQLEVLRRRQAETGAPVGEQIRRALDEHLGLKKAERKRAATRRRS